MGPFQSLIETEKYFKLIRIGFKLIEGEDVLMLDKKISNHGFVRLCSLLGLPMKESN